MTGRVDEANSVTNQFRPMTIQSTLNLKKGDQVWVGMYYTGSSSNLHDNDWHHTHFTGFMLEEEIVASLWGFVLNSQNAQNDRPPENVSLDNVKGECKKIHSILIYWGGISFAKNCQYMWQLDLHKPIFKFLSAQT